MNKLKLNYKILTSKQNMKKNKLFIKKLFINALFVFHKEYYLNM